MIFFNSLNALTDHGVPLNKLPHKKLTDDIKINIKQLHLIGNTVQDAVLLQNRKFTALYNSVKSLIFFLKKKKNSLKKVPCVNIRNCLVGCFDRTHFK